MASARPIRIAGAGIAGLTAAINLARAGKEVELYEVRKDVGWRYRGDFQFLENWTSPLPWDRFLLKIGIEPSFPMSPERGGILLDPGKRRYSINDSGVIGYRIRRGSFPDCLDVHLKEQALALGVRLKLWRRCDPAKADIIATGPKNPLFLAYGLLFRAKGPEGIWVIFDNRLAPGAYAYMVVANGTGLIYTFLKRKHLPFKSRLLEETIKAFKQVQEIEIIEPRRITNFALSPVKSRGRKIVAGEAAGFQDFCWGFGMRYAFLSGYLAANSIIQGTDYWQMVREKILPMIYSSIINRMIWECGGHLGYRLLSRLVSALRRPSIFFRLMYAPSPLKSLLYPLARISMERDFRIRSCR